MANFKIESDVQNMLNLYPSEPEYIIKQALNVDWNEGSNIHNWRNYIGGKTKEIWNDFTDQQKVALALDADYMASKEEWD